MLVWISLGFAMLYLPFQLGFHLPHCWDQRPLHRNWCLTAPEGGWWHELRRGFWRALTTRNQTEDSESWGGLVGAIWMVGYWVLLPYWLLVIAEEFSAKVN